MATDIMKNYGSIEEELERAKSNLKGLNENIRRIIGRDLTDIQLRGDRKRSFNSDQRRGNDRAGLDRSRQRDLSPLTKRRQSGPDTKSVFCRLSGIPLRGGGGTGNGSTGPIATIEEDVKPKLTSRVIKELPTRQEIVAAQGGDAASRARNRRIFGSLLGTLQKFCQEESRLKVKEEKKAQIEKKLEDQQKREREHLRKERQDLFVNRKRQQMEIKMLEMKMIKMKELSVWEEAKKPLMNFVRTKAKPKIYYLPKIVNSKIEKKLADQRADIEKAIQKKRTETEEELELIASRFKTNDTVLANDDSNDKEDQAEISTTKHDRRPEHGDDDDDNDNDNDNIDNDNNNYNDCMYNSDDQNDNLLAPDISIVKQEITSVDITKTTESEANIDSNDILITTNDNIKSEDSSMDIPMPTASTIAQTFEL